MYIKKVFLWAALAVTATATLTSCEDILGHWEKPTPAVPASAVEDARVLGAALEAGATVSVNYTVGSTGYVATFQKNADNTYTLLSNTAAAAGARATTRSIAPPVYTVPVGDAAAGNVLLELVGDKLVFTVKTADGAPIFKAEMNVDGGEVTVVNTNGGGKDCKIGQVSVGDQVKAIVNPEMQTVNISNSDGLVKYAVKYSEGDTWADVVKRYEGVDVVKITTSEDGFVSVKFSKDFIVATLKAIGGYTTNNEAENVYNNDFSSTFYLTTTISNFGSGSRAMTRIADPVPSYVKATDPVGGAATYYLTLIINLSTLTAAHTAHDGEILTGTLGNNVQISIADGATVTLKNVNINGNGTWTDGSYAGITCAGTATINLEGTNTVKGFINTYPGIYVPENETLTINGPGSLTASTGGTHGSGIGGIHWGSCGNITINGGTITAEGGAAAAAIGSGMASSCGDITITGGNVTAIGNINNTSDWRAVGIGCGDGGSDGETFYRAKCGNITISGGTVTATGKNGGVGIGSGLSGDCGTITITSGVTSVTATKGGEDAPCSIGAGVDGTCGTVTIEDESKVTRN